MVQTPRQRAYNDLVRVTLLALVTGCGFRVAATAQDSAAPGDGPRDALGDTHSADAPVDQMTDGAPPTDLIIEAESTPLVTQPRTLRWVARTDVPGYVAASFMFLSGGNGSLCPDPTVTLDTIAACATTMSYPVSITGLATYTLWLKMWADGSSNDSVYVTIDDALAVTAQIVDVNQDSNWHWTKSSGTSTYTLTPGPHTIIVWQREGGARVDRLALMTGTSPPP